jgi:hypothetical protein
LAAARCALTSALVCGAAAAVGFAGASAPGAVAAQTMSNPSPAIPASLTRPSMVNVSCLYRYNRIHGKRRLNSASKFNTALGKEGRKII